MLDQDEWVIARVFQKPGEVPPSRKQRLGLSSAAGGESCFSDSTSASIGGGGASASSAPRPLLTDASLFAAAADSGSYCGAASASANNVFTGRELVPCFSTTTGPQDAALGIGQPYNPVPLAFEPPPAAAFFPNLRSLQDNLQLPLFLSGGLSAGASTLGPLGGGALHWPAAMEMKVEGRAAPQMAVGPGQLDGAFGWGF